MGILARGKVWNFEPIATSHNLQVEALEGWCSLYFGYYDVSCVLVSVKYIFLIYSKCLAGLTRVSSNVARAIFTRQNKLLHCITSSIPKARCPNFHSSIFPQVCPFISIVPKCVTQVLVWVNMNTHFLSKFCTFDRSSRYDLHIDTNAIASFRSFGWLVWFAFRCRSFALFCFVLWCVPKRSVIIYTTDIVE